MSKKPILVFIALFFFFGFNNLAHAGVIINEFASDPDSGPEWIELRNTSSSSVDLDGWTWTELASPGGDTEHESSPKILSGTISAGGVYVFEMNSALNNTGDSIGLYDGTNLEDRVTYGKVNSFSKNLDAPAKGKSGAYIDGNWQANQEPTKNAQNPDSPSSSGDTDSNNSSGSSSTSAAEAISETKTKIQTQKIRVQITGKALAYVGIPFFLEGKVFGTMGEQLYSGKYYWNFGDGDFRETRVINVDKFEHAYFYPGEYTLLLEHYPDVFTETPDAVEKLTIKVVTPEISISSVGGEKDFFVELANNANYSADLSDWFLLSGQKSFLIPRGTNLAANNKMIISSRITHFSIEDKYNLKLMNPQGELIFDYSSSTASKNKVSKTSKQSIVSEVANPEAIDFTDLSASAINSDAWRGEGKTFSSIIPITSFVFIGLSAGAVYYIRRKKVIPEAGNDFEILDE
ncbi:MAG: lamin tail domain-containing protein [Candidatus Paceibacterota bacterium]|jgi:hypothetical protein